MEPIRTCHIPLLAYRYHIHANSRRHIKLPIVHRHTRHDGLTTQSPAPTHTTVLNPQVRVFRRQRIIHFGILSKHGGMRFHLVVHDFPLVDDQILDIQRRRNQFPACSVMIKLSTRKRQDGHTQLIEFFIDDAGMLTERQSEL